MNKNTVVALVVGSVALGYKLINHINDSRLMVHVERYNDSVVKFYEVLGKSAKIEDIKEGPSLTICTPKKSVFSNKEES